ncbi:uncharacterized protein LOC117108969 [Anneissia japonica]|uniref:uncharacterized protein LOC117108969 n=1 Tax=Anneissia japonica TaxID=1529436 RepID=UPI0014258A2E|nr:uncharacterized protein LOC117108969 [Anneissia japonica]
MGLRSLELICMFTIFAINHHGQIGKSLTSVDARIIPPAFKTDNPSEKEDLQNNFLNRPNRYANKLSYSNSESGEEKSTISKPRRSSTDNPDVGEKYPRFQPNDTDEVIDENDRTDGDERGSSLFTTPFPAYTGATKSRHITWGPLPTSRIQPPPRRTTVLHQPRVDIPVTIIAGRIPAQLNSRKQSVSSSIRGVSDSDVGLVAGIFMGIFFLLGMVLVFNIQCIRARFK